MTDDVLFFAEEPRVTDDVLFFAEEPCDRVVDPELQRLKDIAWAYCDLAFNGRQPGEAAARYIGPVYTQHNPQLVDGPEGFVRFVEEFTGRYPELRVELLRSVAEGDLVFMHILLRTSPDDRGTAVVDICRIQDGRVVEHWDVLQPVPAQAANANTMF